MNHPKIASNEPARDEALAARHYPLRARIQNYRSI